MAQRQANGRIASIEGRTPPPGDYTSWDDYMRDVELDAAVPDYDPILCARLSKAMRLAPNIYTFNALLEEQDVPVEALNREWVARYRL